MSALIASPFAKVRSTRAHELIVEQLQNLILGGKLVAGDRLPSEREMMAEFQVSRPTVREALRVTESMGLISVRSGDPGGPKVLGTPSVGLARLVDSLLKAGQASTLELLELRVALDSSAAILAAMAPKKLLAPAAEVLAKMRATAEMEAFTALDASFHEALTAAGGNSLLALVVRGLNESIRNLIAARMTAAPAQSREAALAQHTAILEAVRAGSGEQAARAMRSHFFEFYAPILSTQERKRFMAYIEAMNREQ